MMEPTEKITKPYIEHLICTITLHKQLEIARHEYEYFLKHFGDEEGEDRFYFTIPNAKPDEVSDITVTDNDRHQPSLSKTAVGNGTRLDFTNLAQIAPGQSKVLKFWYEAPASPLLYDGYFIDVGFYRAELHHEYRVDAVTVNINLPKGSTIKEYVGNAINNGATITFEERSLNSNETYTYPIFFYRRKKIITLLAAAGGLILTVVLEKIASSLLDPLWNWFSGK